MARTNTGRPRSLPRGSRNFTARLPGKSIAGLKRLARAESEEKQANVTAGAIVRRAVERELRLAGVE